MDAVAAKKMAASDVPAEIVRHLRNLNDKDLDQAHRRSLGHRPHDAGRSRPAHRRLEEEAQRPAPAADLALGRAVFAKTCMQCHTLYGVGGKVGPDITGSNRARPRLSAGKHPRPQRRHPQRLQGDADHSQERPRHHRHRPRRDADALTVVTANETLTVPVKEIDSRKVSDVSMMPEDLLKPLSETEVRALVAYLRNPTQTPILATTDNAKDLFNGKDLTGWDGDTKLWSVQDGEIVGKSPGIKQERRSSRAR